MSILPVSPCQSLEQRRRLVTEIPGPLSRSLHARREAVVPKGVHSVLPVYVECAHGCVVRDVDGNSLIDMCGGIGVTTVGHTDAGVVAAATEQLGRVTHTLFTMTPYEPYVRVAELLAGFMPVPGYKTLLMNSGAEAVENGVKIARKFTGRPGVAVLENAFHGRTLLTTTMNHKVSPYALGFGPRASDVHRAPGSYPLHDGLSGVAAAERTISHLEKTAGASDLACLVVEPIQGEGGFIVPADGFLNCLQEWCNDNGIVFIADEVQAGVARSGRVYSFEHFGVIPDIVLSAKGIAGGLPLSAVSGRAEIMDVAGPGGLGGTFGGNPVSCAAAVSVLEGVADGELLRDAQRIERVLGGHLRDLAAKFPQVAEVRGRGAMLAMELTEPGSLRPASAVVAGVVREAARNGVILLSTGVYEQGIRFLPALCTPDEVLADVAAVIEDALQKVV